MARGTNLLKVGDYNQRVLLGAIRRSQDGLSRVQLAERTGLSPQAVSNITRRLLDSQLIRTDGVRVNGRGKPRTTLRLNPFSQYAVGIHLDPAVVTVAISNLEGEAVAIARDDSVLSEDPRTTIIRIAEIVRDLINESSIDVSVIAGIGVASPGPIDVRGGSLINPPWLRGWHGYDIRTEFYERLSLPVLLDKDTIAAVTGEMWARSDFEDVTLLFVYLGTGIGSAVAVNGELMRGPSNNAGEIGHLITDPDGAVCECGRRGCLGRASDPSSLVRDAIELGVLSPPYGSLAPHVVDGQISLLCDAAIEGDERASRLLSRSASAVAEGVRILSDIHDANVVVFGGPFWTRLERYYLPAAKQSLLRAPGARIERPLVDGTVMGDAVGAVGAASLVFDSVFSPRPSSFLLDD